MAPRNQSEINTDCAQRLSSLEQWRGDIKSGIIIAATVIGALSAAGAVVGGFLAMWIRSR